MATPLTGPSPGSAPISVPGKQPISSSAMLSGVSATAKPPARRPGVSIASPPLEESAEEGERQPEHPVEQRPEEERHRGPEDRGAERRAARQDRERGDQPKVASGKPSPFSRSA